MKKTPEVRITELSAEDCLRVTYILKQAIKMSTCAFQTLGPDDGLIAFTLAQTIYQFQCATIDWKMQMNPGKIGETCLEFLLDIFERRARAEGRRKKP